MSCFSTVPLISYWFTIQKARVLSPSVNRHLVKKQKYSVFNHVPFSICCIEHTMSSPCFSLQIHPSARRRSRPGLTAWPEASLRAIRTRRRRWAYSVCRSSFASTWQLLTAWCTTRHLTWPPHPPSPTWAWTWASRHRWVRCPASRITSPCLSMRSKCGAALCCRPPPRCLATTARPAALRTCGYAPSNTPPRSASTPCLTNH